MKKLFNYLYKFFYYGYWGTKTVPYDANSVDQLIYAHMKETLKFMESDKTHLLWNSSEKQNKGLMRKLKEFVELCDRKRNTEFRCLHNFSKVIEIYPPRFVKSECGEFFTLESNQESRRLKDIAIKKDNLVTNHLTNRYNYMYTKYISQFWD